MMFFRVVDKTLTPSPCTTHMDYPKMDHATEALIWCMIRVRKLKESLRFHFRAIILEKLT